jgi:hypothetical protein
MRYRMQPDSAARALARYWTYQIIEVQCYHHDGMPFCPDILTLDFHIMAVGQLSRQEPYFYLGVGHFDGVHSEISRVTPSMTATFQYSPEV